MSLCNIRVSSVPRTSYNIMTLRWLKHTLSRRSRRTTAPEPHNPFTLEGLRLSHSLWAHFWSSPRQHFCTAQASWETVDGGGWNGYTLWPFIIAIEALLEAEAASPGSFTQQIHASLNALEKFRSRSLKHAYCAWLWFEGNNDVYYDDNAQVAIAFLRAYSLPSTRRHSYLSSATSLTSWLLTGWDSRGGMRWHISKPDARNACTTNLSAIAALKLAAVGGGWIGPRPLLEFAERCAEWVWTELREGSGLIKDGAGGGPTWTYNTGAAIYTQVLLWQANGREGHKERARQLAEVSCDRGKGLFDGSNPCVQERYWWDSMFFMQLLVEGLVEFSCALGEVYPDMARKAGEEVKRHMLYIMKYMKGREDGLYVRNLRMYVVSVKHVEMYRTLTGDIGRKPELDESERWGDAESLKLPVEKRGVCKTLLGNGGAARSLLIAGRLQQ